MNQQTVNTVIHILLIVAIAVVLLGNTSCSQQGAQTAISAIQAEAARDRAQNALPIVVAGLRQIEWTDDERTTLIKAQAAIDRFAGADRADQLLNKPAFLAARQAYLSAYDVVIARAQQELDAQTYYLALELDHDVRTIGRFLDALYTTGNGEDSSTWQQYAPLARDVAGIVVGLAKVAL